MSALRARLAESGRALREVFANRSLRRLQLAWVGSIIGGWSYVVALAVYAYADGGATAVGLVAVLRMSVSALAAPFTAMLGDRFLRKHVMIGSDLLRAVAMAGGALTIALDGPSAVVYALVTVSSLVGTAYRPAMNAVLPSLAATPQQLTAANVSQSSIESIGVFAGPALGGVLLAVTNVETVFAVNGLSFVWSALLLTALREERAPDRPASTRRSLLGPDAAAGLRTIGADGRLRLLVGLYGAQTFVAGALGVLIVVTALELLDAGEAWVGFLNSAVGVGGVIGAVVALALVGRSGLAAAFGFGVLLFGAPLALVALWPEAAATLVIISLVGIGNTLTDVNAITLLQRSVADDVRARVFGVLQSLMFATGALGALVAPLLVELIGAQGALAVVGAFLPVLVLATRPRLRAIDASLAPPAHVSLLRALPLFAPLPEPTLERLAQSLVPVDVDAGDVVFRRGDGGDRFYVIAGGEALVEPEGQPSRTIGTGDFFGEIALLRDVPRTATVSAQTALSLLALDRDDFLAAVTGHSESAQAADSVISTRLGMPSASAAAAS